MIRKVEDDMKALLVSGISKDDFEVILDDFFRHFSTAKQSRCYEKQFE